MASLAVVVGLQWGKFDSTSSVVEGDGTIFRKTTNSPDYSLCMGTTGANSGTTTWKIKVVELSSSIPLLHFGICAPGDFDPKFRKFKTSEMEGKMFYYSGGGARGTGEIEQSGAGLPAKTAGTIMEMIYDAKAGLLRFVINGAVGATMTVPKEKMFHPFVSCDDPGYCLEFVSTVSAPVRLQPSTPLSHAGTSPCSIYHAGTSAVSPDLLAASAFPPPMMQRNEFKKSTSRVQRGQVAKKIVISGAGTSRVNGEYVLDENAAAQGKGAICYSRSDPSDDGTETIDMTGSSWFICLE